MAAPSLSGVQAAGDYLASGNNKLATSGAMTTTAGRGLIVILAWQDNSAAPTITDSKGNTGWVALTKRTFVQYSLYTVYQQAFLLPLMSSAGAGHTVTSTHTVTDSYPTLYVAEVTIPASTTLAVDSESFATDATSPYASSLTTVAADVLALCGTLPDNSSPFPAFTGTASGWANIYNRAGTGLWPQSNYSQTVTTPGATAISITYDQAMDGEPVGLMMFGLKATGGGVSLTPGAASIAFTGSVPTVARTANQALVPSTAALTLSGPAPTLVRTANQALVPGVGSVAFTGYAPVVSQSAGAALVPAAGAVAFTGYVPTVARTANQALTPSAGAVTFTGLAPVVSVASASVSLVPGASALTFTGWAPDVAQSGGGGGSSSTGTAKKKKRIERPRQSLQEFIEQKTAKARVEPEKVLTVEHAESNEYDEDEDDVLMLLG